MLNQLKDIFGVIGSKNKINSLKLLLILLLIVIFELLSIGLIIPGVSLLLDIDTLTSFKYFFLRISYSLTQLIFLYYYFYQQLF